jgi:hypothetical protein
MAQTDTHSIIAGLQHLMHAREALDLLNVYKGVPVVYPATIQHVADEQVSLRVSTPEAICLTLEKTTTVLHHGLDEAVTASVADVNLGAQTAVLSKLHYAAGHIGDRMTVRVAPPSAVEVPMECGGHSLSGTLIDISMGGLGVHVPAGSPNVLRPRAVVQLTLALPAATLKMSGTVRFSKSAGDSVRVGINFAQHAKVMPILHYVRERQAEIMQELLALYRAAVPGT